MLHSAGTSETPLDPLCGWCESVLGSFQVAADHSKAHGGHESSTYRLQTAEGFCYLKLHQSEFHWRNEVSAYMYWVDAFDEFAPRLLAIHDREPLALVVTELPGKPAEHAQLSVRRQHALWRAAGSALVALHHRAVGQRFGASAHAGNDLEEPAADAIEHVSRRFSELLDQAQMNHYLNPEEAAILQQTYQLIPAFAGERPIPCHRDYCMANWLVSENGVWTGVIDFEFAQWDVRVADFSRDPDWFWVHRSDLFDALLEGYGRPLSSVETDQLLVARAEYALGAIVWGHNHAFYGFAQEGRIALERIGAMLG